MKLRKHIFSTLLLSIGFILHQITPGILGGMKFDFLLIFMFVSILLNKEKSNIILISLVGGILSALTTTFPGGQIPNILDKIATCIVVYILIRVMERFEINSIIIGIIGGIGTFVSGITFLGTASVVVGLPVPMKLLVVGIVLPTTLVNTMGTIFIYKIVGVALRTIKTTI